MQTETPDVRAKAAAVRTMFDGIAGGYDRLNDVITAGRHRAWKRRLVSEVAIRAGEAVLDVCTGTGDLAGLAAEAAGPTGTVTGLDFSEVMLALARERPASPPREAAPIAWVAGDATALPFESGSFDVVLVGFGLRNVADLGQALGEMVRVLRPGGRLGSLDLGKPRAGWLRLLADRLAAWAVPRLAGLAGGERDAYRYLPESNRAFPDQRELARRFQSAGLGQVAVRDLALGTLALVVGTKTG